MKRTALITLILAMVASNANGSWLSLRWAEVGENIQQMAIGDTKTVEVVFEFTPDMGYGNAILSTVFFSLIPAPLTLVSQAPLPAGWDALGVQGPLTDTHQVNLFAQGANDLLTVPGTYILGTFDLTLTGGVLGDTVDLMFQHETVGVLDEYGHHFPHDAEMAASYSGYYAYGKGSPDMPNPRTGQPANPLQLQVIPEPATLVTLAISALIVLRRR